MKGKHRISFYKYLLSLTNKYLEIKVFGMSLDIIENKLNLI